MTIRFTFPEYALALAEAASLRSEDPRNQVGAVVLRADNTVAGVGYNGAPTGMAVDWADESAVRRVAIHAEANALRLTTRRDAEGGLMACTLHPCSDCLRAIAAYGITRIYYSRPAGLSHMEAPETARLLGLRVMRVWES
jgi:dCMP deaminase